MRVFVNNYLATAVNSQARTSAKNQQLTVMDHMLLLVTVQFQLTTS